MRQKCASFSIPSLRTSMQIPPSVSTGQKCESTDIFNLLFVILFFADRGYFYKWWTDSRTTCDLKDKMRKIISNKQVQFAGAGWVQNDEAVTIYSDVIHQMTLGHMFVYRTFGVKPNLGWQIDPFGKSKLNILEMAALIMKKKNRCKLIHSSTFLLDGIRCNSCQEDQFY